MNSPDGGLRSDVRFEAGERPPLPIAAGMGLQLAVLSIAGIVITPAIVIRAAGGTEAFLNWAVFGAVLISGLTTILQAVRVGRIGAGYVLLMGTSGAFIAVCITAIAEGGPAMLATLVIISALFQFLLATRLALFRRILTQTVTGTVIMLIAVTVMPIVFEMATQAPAGTSPAGAPVSVLVTMVVIIGLALKARRALRLWAPVIGVIVGAIASSFFGLYDTARVASAGWIGLPTEGWPGLDLSFGPLFWTLLPSFLFVTLVGAIETIGDSVAIQQVSWRRPRAVDFKAVQGAVAADGVGNLLSGLVGTVPNTTYSSSIAVTELTGVASRMVGVAIGVVFICMAFLPKFLALVVAIPEPVAGGFLLVLIAMLFVTGMRIVVQDGVTYRDGLIAGLAFWVGFGFQNEMIFPEYVANFAGGLLQNGMTSGGLTAVLLTLFMELTEPIPRRLEVELGMRALPDLRQFIASFSDRCRWSSAMTYRLQAVAEETMLTLVGEEEKEEEPRRLLFQIRKRSGEAILEFIASTDTRNLQDQISLLSDKVTGSAVEEEVSLRLLRHLTSSVRHQRYHNADIVTCHVQAPSETDERTVEEY